MTDHLHPRELSLASLSRHLAGLLLLLLAGCSGASEQITYLSTPPQTTQPTAETGVQPEHSILLLEVPNGAPGFRQSGSANVRLDVTTLEGGELRTQHVDGRRAARFPSYVSSGTYPRAAVTVRTPLDAQDRLQPGTMDFTLRAHFRLDPVTAGRTDDNGDNLLQRGLASDAAQYKLELNHSRPACRVEGSEGVLEAQSTTELEPETWYEVTCSRQDDSLRLEVIGPEPVENVTTISGPVGNILFDRSVPLSVGGKVTRQGELVRSATDQFNGSISSVELRVRTG